jgi:hypothetical protein
VTDEVETPVLDLTQTSRVDHHRTLRTVVA